MARINGDGELKLIGAKENCRYLSCLIVRRSLGEVDVFLLSFCVSCTFDPGDM